jgi:branched-chain amino acid transport system permease protein
MRWRGGGAIVALVAAGVAVQLAASITGRAFYLTQLTMSAYYAVVALGLCLLMGYAGQASLGQAGFFAIGGYLAAFLTTWDLTPHHTGALAALLGQMHLLSSRHDAYGGTILHVHPWAALPIAVSAASLTAWLIAGPVFRLRGHYLAMATLGFGIIVHRVFLGTAAFGAADGLAAVPGLPLGFGLEVCGKPVMRVANFYVAWGVLTAAIAALLNLVRSRVGLALRAIHGSENAAAAVGVPIAAFKTRTFVVAAALAALAGVLLTHFNGGIGPSEASVMKSVRYVAIVAVGGMANLWGALLMGTLLNFLSLRGSFGTYDDLVFGGILILMMLFAPEGIVGAALPRRLRASIGRGRGGDDAAA